MSPFIASPAINFFIRKLNKSLEELFGITLFCLKFFRYIFRPPFEWAEVRKHLDELGSKSLPLVSVVGLLMGIILAMQSRPVLERFGAGSFLPSMLALTIVREMGPVIIALVVAGRVSSGIGAELGSMKVTEQIDALEVSAVDPFNYLVVTRTLACTIMMPLIVAYVDFVAIFGGYISEMITFSSSFQLYFSEVIGSLTFRDIIPGVGKTAVFGFIIGIIGCYKGFTSENGTEGVGRAATTAVVLASLNIIFFDMLMVRLTYLIFGFE